MLAGDTPITITARSADPYVHLDNRGLVISDGRHGVVFPANALPWVGETIALIVEEKRATRRQSDLVLGGFIGPDDGSATLYGGPSGNVVSVVVPLQALKELGEETKPKPGSTDPGGASRPNRRRHA